MHSPLYKTRHTLKILRWTCGFPLQTKDSSYTSFRFVTCIEIIRFIFVFFLLKISYLYGIALILIHDGNLSNVVTFYEAAFDNFTTSRTDQIVMFVWQTFIFFSLIAYIVTFKCNTESISAYCKEISAVKSELQYHFARNVVRNKPKCCRIEGPEKTIIYQQIINLTASILSGIWVCVYFFSMMDRKVISHYGDSLPVVYGLVMGIETFWIVFGPISCSVELIICQLINSLTDTFDHWIEISKLKCDTKQANGISNRQEKGCEDVEINVLSCEM